MAQLESQCKPFQQMTVAEGMSGLGMPAMHRPDEMTDQAEGSMLDCWAELPDLFKVLPDLYC